MLNITSTKMVPSNLFPLIKEEIWWEQLQENRLINEVCIIDAKSTGLLTCQFFITYVKETYII